MYHYTVEYSFSKKGKATEMEVKWKAFHVLLANGQFFTYLCIYHQMCYLGTVVEHKLQWNANTDISFLLKNTHSLLAWEYENRKGKDVHGYS